MRRGETRRGLIEGPFVLCCRIFFFFNLPLCPPPSADSTDVDGDRRLSVFPNWTFSLYSFLRREYLDLERIMIDDFDDDGLIVNGPGTSAQRPRQIVEPGTF